MRYLVSYDIPASRAGDRRRAKLARRLTGLGLRVQFSLFEVEIPPENLPALLSVMEEVIDPGEDNVRVYGICASCQERAHSLGVSAVCEHGQLLIW